MRSSRCVPAGVEPWLQPLLDERARGAALGVERLRAALGQVQDMQAWIERACFDPAAAYGRRVVVAEDGLELMVAGWSRGRPCAPHDHGPGQGAVRVLQGRARHRGFRLDRAQLHPGPDERLEPGAVLRCPQGFIHQMEDDGAPEPLVTLHLYAGSTSPMTVYDLAHGRTQWLDGSCGAWPRSSEDACVLASAPGYVAAAAGPLADRQP